MDLWTVPVFYHVDPSHVHNEMGRFGQLFEDLMKKTLVTEKALRRCGESLNEVSNLAGFDASVFRVILSFLSFVKPIYLKTCSQD